MYYFTVMSVRKYKCHSLIITIKTSLHWTKNDSLCFYLKYNELFPEFLRIKFSIGICFKSTTWITVELLFGLETDFYIVY